ncbi:FimB/Mfa2 family fimbrial subunit [Heminiphilus faecis]|uniref:FimB/Mfa2 family fimbrial subunit n=1 Tax=Heminiphilus faecis TaxID=2601703 RepID=A0ABV4CZF3_9BACT
MFGKRLTVLSRLIGAMCCIASMGFAFTSCESLYEDLDPCPHGVRLRFVYDYNMEWANAFPKQVDCLSLFIYDNDGNFVDKKTVTGAELQDESYRMTLDLEPGNYQFVAFGGLACDKAAFSLVKEPAPESRRIDLSTLMHLDRVYSPQPAERRLHDMFWGDLSLATSDLYTEGTVKMMKNTNNIRVVLQQEKGGTVHPDDFDFSITDCNSLFGHDNDLITDGVDPVVYTPWATGQAQTGVSILGDEVVPQPVTVAYAEMSTSRLMTKNTPRLLITRSGDGATVIDFPLIKYLALLCSDRYKQPPYSIKSTQEYLDRESDYTLFFFLRTDGTWLNTRIVVNDWVVRINDAEF